jgi:hypothetical protein
VLAAVSVADPSDLLRNKDVFGPGFGTTRRNMSGGGIFGWWARGMKPEPAEGAAAGAGTPPGPKGDEDAFSEQAAAASGAGDAGAGGFVEVADKAGEEARGALEAAAEAVPAEAADGLATVAAEVAAELGNWPSDYVVRLLELWHDATGMPYWVTIIAATVVFRVALFPLNIRTAQSAARMQLMKPELDGLTERYDRARPRDREAQKK